MESTGKERERVESFEQMKVWQESHALVMKVFETSPKLPEEQQEGIALAMEKAAVEVPRFIAEGFKRRGSRNKAHYYNMAQSSLESLRYYFILCRDLKYTIDFADLSQRGDQVSRMLDGLIRSMIRNNRDGGGPRRGGGGRGRGPGRGGDDHDHDDRDDLGPSDA